MLVRWGVPAVLGKSSLGPPEVDKLHQLDQWSSDRWFYFPGDIQQCLQRTIGCHNWEVGATGIQWVKSRDVARYSTKHRTVYTSKN